MFSQLRLLFVFELVCFFSLNLLQIERGAQLKTQLLDSEATVRKLNVQVEELKLQVKQTQAGLYLIPEQVFCL